IKKYYQEDPIFADTKIGVSLYDDEFPKNLHKKFLEKHSFDGFNKKDIKQVTEESNHLNLMKMAVDYSDGLIQGVEKLNPEIEKYIKKTGKPFLSYKNELEYMDAFNEFYDLMLEEANVLT